MSNHDILCRKTGKAIAQRLDGGTCKCESHCLVYFDDQAMTPTEPVAEAGGVNADERKSLHDAVNRLERRMEISANQARAFRHAIDRTAPATSAPADPERAILPPNCEGPLEVRTTYERVHAPAGDGEAEKLAQIIVDQALKEGFREHFGLGDIKLVADQAARIYLRAQPPQPTGDVGLTEQEMAAYKASIATEVDLRDSGSSGDDMIADRIEGLLTIIDRLNSRLAALADQRDYYKARDDEGAKIEAELREAAKGQLVVVNIANARAEAAEARVAELENAVNEACDIAIGASDDMTRTAKQRIDDLRKIAALSPTEPAGRENGR